LLRRWVQLTQSEQLEMELKLAVARRALGFSWSKFCRDNSMRQWSLRRVLDVPFGKSYTRGLAKRAWGARARDRADEVVAARRADPDESVSLTAALLGDPHPTRSALARSGPARLWQPILSIATERRASAPYGMAF